MAEVVEAAIEEVERVEEGLRRRAPGAARRGRATGRFRTPGEHLGSEAAADDGAGPRDSRASGDSRATRARTASSIVSGTCASRIARAVEARLVVERRQQLLDMEGDAVGPLVDRVDDLARRREARRRG